MNNNIFNMKLDPVYIELIRNGIKTVEGRINDDKRKSIDQNDIINFSNNLNPNDTIKCLVVKKNIFNNLDEYLNFYEDKDTNLINCIIPGKNIEEGRQIYLKIYEDIFKENYNIEMVAFELSLI